MDFRFYRKILDLSYHLEAKKRICNLVESEIKEGAKLLLDGRGIVVPGFEKGNFVGPTILFDVKGVNFCTQLKTITQLWREQDATDSKAATSMPVMK
ncbi:Methylmalonate-semialdehyde dehydrogenase like protein [Argiope bruennichi]|uniref:Probable methylmalonate-semialdehyde/malonate-semialdehyde dehydrogenase [acylating], mitochondrial n=1 Tax=Argiope bruennichi TaxID=94029 RepID=A0A8T0FED1_ARGBR|nr:Methylmalonate-semialdehyde dehydrogenase like protein [Argiope bruennichi]